MPIFRYNGTSSGEDNMAFFYNENEPFTGGVIPYHKVNANRSYLRHYENSLFLQFMLNNGTMEERRQASKELAICDRKMSRMEKHANFIWDAVLPEIEKLKKNWHT